jgi:hypothetical protein
MSQNPLDVKDNNNSAIQPHEEEKKSQKSHNSQKS